VDSLSASSASPATAPSISGHDKVSSKSGGEHRSMTESHKSPELENLAASLAGRTLGDGCHRDGARYGNQHRHLFQRNRFFQKRRLRKKPAEAFGPVKLFAFSTTLVSMRDNAVSLRSDRALHKRTRGFQGNDPSLGSCSPIPGRRGISSEWKEIVYPIVTVRSEARSFGTSMAMSILIC